MPRKFIPVPVPAGSKYCHSCGTVKPLAGFNIDRRAKDGRRYCCSPCDVVKAVAAKANRRLLASIERRLNRPHTVTTAERAAVANAVAEALRSLNVPSPAPAGPVGTNKPRKRSPAKPAGPYDTLAARKAYADVCGGH